MHYTKRNNRYFKVTKKSKRITSKKAYYSYVRRKLMKSVYPTQYKDFSFLRIPKHFYQNGALFKKSAGKYVPVDYLLKNIVLCLWSNQIETYGWDQSRPEAIKSQGFITFKPINENKEKIFKLFGKKNISNQKTNDKIFFEDCGNFMAISFHHNMLPWIHNKLNINIPDHSEAYPGNLIDFKDYDDGRRVYLASDKFENLIEK
jgi:hypothetical protein